MWEWGGGTGWGGWVTGHWVFTCLQVIFRSETRLLSLHLLRKIYLYLQYNASNTARAQVTVYVGTKQGHEGGHQGPKVPVQYFSLSFLIIRHTTQCASVFLYFKHKPVGYKYTATHPVGEFRFILDIGMLCPFISLCYSFVTILLF